MNTIELGPFSLENLESFKKKLEDLQVPYEVVVENAESFVPEEDIFRVTSVQRNLFFEIGENDFKKNRETLALYQRAISENTKDPMDSSFESQIQESNTSGMLHGKSFIDWYFDCVSLAFKNCFVIKGRSGRGEYWSYKLSYFVLLTMLSEINKNIPTKELARSVYEFTSPWGHWLDRPLGYFLISLPTILIVGLAIPCVALAVRRFHDVGKSGWWTLILLTPFLNLYGIVLTFRRSDGPNKFGPAPDALA